MNAASVFTGLFLFLSLGSCKTTQSGNASDTSQNALDWNGVYTGTLPCADCEGIATTLQLKRDKTYSMEMRYLGKSDMPTLSQGTFSWNRAGSIITLNNVDKKTGPSAYAVGENQITQLDLNGKRITGALADRYVLRKASSDIVEKYWKLIEINGRPVPPPANTQREAHMILKAADQRIQGSSGCNTFSGTYEVMADNRIQIGRVAATKMACMNGMETEDALFKVFEQADGYAVQQDTLSLTQARMTPLARFVVVYLR